MREPLKKKEWNMEGTESATAEPVMTESQNLDQPIQGTEGGVDGEAPKVDPAIELAKLQERYKYSSEEGKKLYQEKKALESKLADLEKSSLTDKAVNSSGNLPSEDAIVTYKIKELGKDERTARHEARLELSFMAQQQATNIELEALKNMIRFQSEQQNKLAVSSDPIAKEAEAFFSEWPEMKGLSAVEKTERYKMIKPQLAQRVSGRDTSALKTSASVAGTYGEPKAVTGVNPQLQAAAQSLGLKGGVAQLLDQQKATTQESYNAYKAKWKLK